MNRCTSVWRKTNEGTFRKNEMGNQYDSRERQHCMHNACIKQQQFRFSNNMANQAIGWHNYDKHKKCQTESREIQLSR